VPDYDPEQSELLLYHVKILEDMGEIAEALTLLDINAKSRAILDRVAVMETRGVILSSVAMFLLTVSQWQLDYCQSKDPGKKQSKRGAPLFNVIQTTRVIIMDFLAVKASNLVCFIRPSGLLLFINQPFWSDAGAVTDTDRPTALRLLQDLSKQNPRTITPERLELTVTSG
jgi:N-alpha-acetyltransferase 15/16, NatA auxiliary subunit